MNLNKAHMVVQVQTQDVFIDLKIYLLHTAISSDVFATKRHIVLAK